jgi:exopolysaccharide biosynthesis polyprenyl glycosylphosphotransferase
VVQADGAGGDPRRLIEETQPDRIFLVRNSFSDDEILRLLETVPEHISVNVVPSTWDSIISRLALGPMMGDLRIFEIRSPLADPVTATAKRIFDLGVALLALSILAPLFALVAALIRLDSPGPVFYIQRRVGRRGRLFHIVKFRTMTRDAESRTGAVVAQENDPRVTRLGRWLRAFRIDEIPQLWNVFWGDMSLVGPRPERPELADRYQAALAGYDLRHLVRPGITGLAQVYGRYRSHPREKLRFDLAYVYNYSFGLEAVLLVKTMWNILTRRAQ